MSLELTGVHGLLKRHKLFTHKYWEEEEKKINRSFGPREDEQAAFEEIDVIVMYNREDRHWCYEPSLDLSGFTEKVCGTITMYVRD